MIHWTVDRNSCQRIYINPLIELYPATHTHTHLSGQYWKGTFDEVHSVLCPSMIARCFDFETTSSCSLIFPQFHSIKVYARESSPDSVTSLSIYRIEFEGILFQTSWAFSQTRFPPKTTAKKKKKETAKLSKQKKMEIRLQLVFHALQV